MGWGWGSEKSFTIQFLKHEVKVASMELQSARLQSAHKPFRLRKPWVFRSGTQEIAMPPSKEVEVAGPSSHHTSSL